VVKQIRREFMGQPGQPGYPIQNPGYPIQNPGYPQQGYPVAPVVPIVPIIPIPPIIIGIGGHRPHW